jgi:toxin ParE1/3/4
MAVVNVTKNAKKDLKEIHDFVAKKSVQNAKKLLLAIRKEFRILEKHPEIVQIVKELNSPTFRELKIYKFRIIYYIETDTSYILTIHHSARLLSNNTHLKDLF